MYRTAFLGLVTALVIMTAPAIAKTRVSDKQWQEATSLLSDVLLPDLMMCATRGDQYKQEAEELYVAYALWNYDMDLKVDDDIFWDKVNLRIRFRKGTPSTSRECDAALSGSQRQRRVFEKK